MFGRAMPKSLQDSLAATKVDYVRLGSSGLRVSWPILGCMTFGSPQIAPWALEEDAAIEILKAAYDCGINTWDTANTYSNGLSEEIIGKAIKKLDIPRQKVVIMTKCAFYVGDQMDIVGNAFPEELSRSKDYVNRGGLSRTAIFDAVEGSLARLGTTYIDVLQIHRLDLNTPSEETMKALHDLVQLGKVRYIGASSMWATEFAQLQFVAERNGWTKFVSMQNYYHLCYREEEREMNRYCKATGVGLVPWRPLFAGKLVRPLDFNDSVRSKESTSFQSDLTPADKDIIGRVEQVAKKKGWKMSEVALIWHKQKGTIPIVGMNSVQRVFEACDLKGKSLTNEEVQYLEEPYIPRQVFGHW